MMLDTIKEIKNHWFSLPLPFPANTKHRGMPTPKILTFCFSMKEFKGEAGASQKQWLRLTAAIIMGIVGSPEVSAHRIFILAAH